MPIHPINPSTILLCSVSPTCLPPQLIETVSSANNLKVKDDDAVVQQKIHRYGVKNNYEC